MTFYHTRQVRTSVSTSGKLWKDLGNAIAHVNKITRLDNQHVAKGSQFEWLRLTNKELAQNFSSPSIVVAWMTRNKQHTYTIRETTFED